MGKSMSIFIEELQASDPSGLEEENRRLEECLKTLEQETTENMDRRGAIGNQIEQLEHGSEGSLTRVMQESLLEGLHEKSREWASWFGPGKSLLKQSKSMRRKGSLQLSLKPRPFFQRLPEAGTRGFIPRSTLPKSMLKIGKDVKRASGTQPGNSRTALSLPAFRFYQGIRQAFGISSVVFDDVLVNFDPERCKSTCEAIKDLVSGNQVFYFTCHPETVQMLVERFPEARAVDLDKVA